MTIPDDITPSPSPSSTASWVNYFGGVTLIPGILFLCMRTLGLTTDRPVPPRSVEPRPAFIAPATPSRPQASPEKIASEIYWALLHAIMIDRRRSGTSLISVATDFQLKADEIRRISHPDVDPAALRCGEAVAAYYNTIARVYRYSLSGAQSMQIIAQMASGKNNGVLGTSIEMMAEMTHRRAEAVSAATAAQFALEQRFGPGLPPLPPIR